MIAETFAFTLFTLATYALMNRISCFLQSAPLANPIATSIVLIALVLHASGISYHRYAAAVAPLTFLLGPATVALAVPIYRRTALIRRSLLAIVVGLVAGSLCAIASVTVVSRLLGAPDVVVRSLAPRSVTAAVAIGLSPSIGGVASLTTAFVVGGAIFGSVLTGWILPVALRRDPSGGTARYLGFGIGIAAHGIGTARAIALDEEAGTFAGLAMGLNALFSAIAIPIFAAAAAALH